MLEALLEVAPAAAAEPFSITSRLPARGSAPQQPGLSERGHQENEEKL